MDSSPIDVVYGHVSHLPPTTLRQARWKAMTGLELSGYVHVKQSLKDRKFSSWKAWKKLWCVISKNNNGISLQIGNDKNGSNVLIFIPEDALLCRTESRSQRYAFGIFQANKVHKGALLYLSGESETDTQKWMSNIRFLLKPSIQTADDEKAGDDHFEISIIDNHHSREAGLAGLYGYLCVTPSEVIIKDPHTNKMKATWHWSQISHTYLPLPANSQDVHRICTIHTTSKFKNGEGELEVFCMEADKLHEKLLACPRPLVPRILSSPLPPTPEPTPPPTPPRARASPSGLNPQALLSRRMSRSENDLQRFFLQRSLNSLRQNSAQELILLSNENVSNMHKVPSLLFANIGFLISTPGGSISSLNEMHCSEPHQNEKPHEFHKTIQHERVEYEMIDEEELEQIQEGICEIPVEKHTRVSVMSGDYEEMILQPGEYEDEYKALVDTPPPLPPRKSTNLEMKKPTPLVPGEYIPMAGDKYLPLSRLKEKILVSGPVQI